MNKKTNNANDARLSVDPFEAYRADRAAQETTAKALKAAQERLDNIADGLESGARLLFGTDERGLSVRLGGLGRL